MSTAALGDEMKIMGRCRAAARENRFSFGRIAHRRYRSKIFSKISRGHHDGTARASGLATLPVTARAEIQARNNK